MKLRESEILRYMGYGGQELDPELQGRINAVIAQAEADFAPKFTWAVYPCAFHGSSDGVPYVEVLGTTLKLEGHDICRHLEGATQVGLLAATVGLAFELKSKRYLGKPLESLVYDACGTECVELAADAAEAEVVEYAARQGLVTNWRFSPGYGDLPLTCQHDFLSVLGAHKQLGITLTPQLLMVPSKSVTAVLGLFEHEGAETRVKCDTCSLRETCKLRAGGNECWKR